MNIYLHVEISSRELDSKLLLATLAASRGHRVIVSDLVGIEKGVKSDTLLPGIFHTKDLSPLKYKIDFNKVIIAKDFLVTSMDEEGNLNDYGYEIDVKTRFSDETVNQASAIFGWGSDDVNTLKKIYPNHSSKIFKTGSPRADLWRPLFEDFWNTPSKIPKKQFLLISCNTGNANNINSLSTLIKRENEMDRYHRAPSHLERTLGRYAEEFYKIIEYINCVRYLSENNNGYEIVFRPHPAEDIESWKILLKDIPKVHILREGSITEWVQHAFAVMHNSCTTALEATISKKPLVTYLLPNQKYTPQLANELGQCVKSLKELNMTVNNLFELSKNKKNSNNETHEPLPTIISNKIFIDDQLAAEKIIKIWEKIDNKNLSKPFDVKKFKSTLKKNFFKEVLKKVFNYFSPTKKKSLDQNAKFLKLNEIDIKNKVKKIQNILGITEKIEAKLLCDKTIYIKKI